MLENEREQKILFICKKRGWRVATISNLPDNKIEKEFQRIVLEQQKSAINKAKYVESNTEEDTVFIGSKEEYQEMYPDYDFEDEKYPPVSDISGFLGPKGPHR